MERAEPASDMPQTRVDSSQSNGSATEEATANLDRTLNPWAPDEGRYVTLGDEVPEPSSILHIPGSRK